MASNPDAYGRALAEIQKQMENIESDFSQFVTLNSSGDPVEAAEILDKTEDRILALTQIVEKVPAIVEDLTEKLPDQLEDLESGYRKLLETNYHFIETDLEARFQQLRASWSWIMPCMRMNKFKRKSMLCMPSLLERLRLIKSLRSW